MFRFPANCRAAAIAVLALAVCGALPATASAAWMGYRNDTNFVVVVQGSSQGPNGQVRRGQPHQINPREAAWDQVQAGPKTITVIDPRTNRPLWSGQVIVGEKDIFLGIQVDGVMLVGTERVPRVKVAPVAIPAAMPRR